MRDPPERTRALLGELLSAIVSRPRTDRTTIAKTTSSNVEEHAVIRTRRSPADGSHDDLADAGGGGAGKLFREDREGEGFSDAAGVARGSNFGEAWAHVWADPGHPRVPPEDSRATSEEPGSPEGPRRPRRGYVEGRAQATRGLFRFSGGLRHPVEARPGGSRVAGRGHDDEGQAGLRHGDSGACRPGNTGVKPGYSLVTEHRDYTRAVRGYTEVNMPGENQAHARVTPKEHPCAGGNRPSPRVEPRAGVGAGRDQGQTRA